VGWSCNGDTINCCHGVVGQGQGRMRGIIRRGKEGTHRSLGGGMLDWKCLIAGEAMKACRPGRTAPW